MSHNIIHINGYFTNDGVNKHYALPEAFFQKRKWRNEYKKKLKQTLFMYNKPENIFSFRKNRLADSFTCYIA